MALSPYSSNSYNPKNENNTWYKMIHMVPEGSEVLDIGCSAGGFGEALQRERGAIVDGVDITSADVKQAQKRLRKAWVMDIEADTLPDKRYDVVVFADVLEHMKNPVGVLQRVKSLLKPDGIVIFSIPNMAHISVRLQLLEGSFNYSETGLLDYTHLHFYDETEVRRIFNDASYDIQKFDCTTFDYPEKLLKEKLSHLGLRPSAKFFKIASSKQATIFEYVGFAKPLAKGVKASLPRLKSSPVDEVTAYIARVEEAHASKVKDLKAKIKLSEEHVAKLENIINEERIAHSRPLVSRLYRKIRRR